MLKTCMHADKNAHFNILHNIFVTHTQSKLYKIREHSSETMTSPPQRLLIHTFCVPNFPSQSEKEPHLPLLESQINPMYL